MPTACPECGGTGFKRDGITPCPRCNAGAAPRPRLSSAVQSVLRNRGTPPLWDVASWGEKFADKSIGETVRLLVAAGVDETVASNTICQEYLRAHSSNDGSTGRQSWVQVGLDLLKQIHAERRAATVSEEE